MHEFGGKLIFWTTKTINYDAHFLWKMVVGQKCSDYVAKDFCDFCEQASVETFQL